MTRLLLFGALAAVAITVGVIAVIPQSQGKATGTSKVETVGLPEHQLEVIGPKHPTYNKLMAVDTSSADKGKTTPFSVFVVNNAGQSVAACVVKWEVLLPDGQIVTHIRSKIGTLQTVSHGGSAHLTSIIAANGNQLFSLEDASSSPTQPGTGVGFRTSGSPDIDRQLSDSVKVTVSIEGVLFVDGTFVGPDTENYFEQLRGEIEANRDLNTEIAQLIDAGAEPEAIMNHLETVSKTQSNSTQNSSGEHPRYSFGKWFGKRGYAKLLLLTGKTKGDKALLERIRTELSKPQVNLRRL